MNYYMVEYDVKMAVKLSFLLEFGLLRIYR